MRLPEGFVYLRSIDPTIIQDLKYFSSDNFIGRPIEGYEAGECILTHEAALALSKLQQELLLQNVSLKIFDAYRPQRAVNDFFAWSQEASDQRMKKEYYPCVNKADFFHLGYLAEKSSHSRGSTVDLTLVHIHNNTMIEMDMGTRFDFMDDSSHTFNANVQDDAKKNRLFLREKMQQAGFVPYDKEWWHFTLKNEPYVNTYFDFLIQYDLVTAVLDGATK